MNPATQAIDSLTERQSDRHRWILQAATQINQMREQDRRAGVIWNDEITQGDRAEARGDIR